MEELLRQQEQIAVAIEAEVVRARDEAARGAAQGQYELAVLMHFARGVPKNYPEAMKLYKLAAAQGHTGAQLNLGLMFENAQGASEDFVQALNWYKQAATHGNGEALWRLQTGERLAPNNLTSLPNSMPLL